MKEIKCENCGSRNLKLYAGKYTCEHCGSVFAAEYSDGTAVDQFRFFETENDVLIRYFGFDRIVEIPEGITRVEEGAFDHKTIRTLRCPASLTEFEGTLKDTKELQIFEAPGLKKITGKLFSENRSVKKIVLENVQKIPRGAFYGCSALKEIIIPKATTIGASAFQDCSELKELSIPNATTIGKHAFQNSGICSLNAPNVKEIKDFGFQWCNGLKEITFPALETMGECGFGGCENLKHIVLPTLMEVGESGFGGCENLNDIEAPRLEILGARAFEACSSLKKVVLPSVRSIDEFAFYNCEELTEVVCENATLVANEHGNYNQFIDSPKIKIIKIKEMPKQKKILKDFDSNQKSGGCYVATAVYGSYDCPQVWTLRRYRDKILAATWCGRAFIRTYYAISPTIVKWFGNTEWFKNIWRNKLDKMVAKLQANGVDSTPYKDKNW